MSENTFVEKRYIWIFIMLILMLHVMIYLMTEVKFNGYIKNKSSVTVAVYRQWKGFSVNFRSFLGQLLTNGHEVGKQAADGKTTTKYPVNEADLTVIVDR